jgi:coatomer subunit beta
VNQTNETLQNLCLDFSTLGDLKLVERPSVHTVAPQSFLTVKASIKVVPFFHSPNKPLMGSQVSSTETGVIFGNILWEGVGTTEVCVILNDMHIDIMDYIRPASCNEAQVLPFLNPFHTLSSLSF